MRRRARTPRPITGLSTSQMCERMKDALHDESTTPADLCELLLTCGRENLAALAEVSRQTLESHVPGKSYFAFARGSDRTRAVNDALFRDDPDAIERFLSALRADKAASIPAEEITHACYALAMSFACRNDLRNKDDKRTPGLFFEHMVGSLLFIRLGIRPRKQIQVLNLDLDTPLTTDFTFDLGRGNPKFHVPVKLSTRERVIQVWAHQKVLDGVYGTGRFLGLLVCLGETSSAKTGVVEVCLPDQWRIYQMFIAKMHTIYYLDLPYRYVDISREWPVIRIKSFGEYFAEADTLGLQG